MSVDVTQKKNIDYCMNDEREEKQSGNDKSNAKLVKTDKMLSKKPHFTVDVGVTKLVQNKFSQQASNTVR